MKLVSSTNRFVLGVFAAVLLAISTSAADTNLYSGPIWAPVDAAKVLASVAAITTDKYPDCDDALVERKSMRLYRADGTGESQDETYTKVLTEKGRRGNRTLSYGYMLPYSTVEVASLELIKADGHHVVIDVAANSKVTIDEGQMQANIYDPNSKVLQVNIPGVEIGDLIHSVARETIARSIIAGQYAEESVFEAPSYILHASYEVHAPAERPIQRIFLRDEVPGTVKYAKTAAPDGGVVHHWEVNNVPRMFNEPDMPPYEMVLQRLYVSTLPDWQAVSKWYWNLSKPHLDANTPEMKQTVDKITAGATNEMDRIKDVFYYVSKNIRYMGLTPEQDRPGFEPHDVHLTYEKKYGVCRDKAGLLVEMLRLAGLDSYPVLISVGTKRDRQAPDPDFNHAIVSVELKKGEYLLMDPTDENTRELLPNSDCNQSFLVCRPEGEDLKISPVPPASEHMMRVVTTGTLSASGTLQAKSELFFDGVNDDEYRNAFAKMKPDDERRFFERNLKRSIPGARLRTLNISPSNMLDMASSLHAELEFSADGLTAASHGTALVSLPWIGKNFGIINFIMDGAGLDQRKYPLETQFACGVSESVALKLGEGFGRTLALPSFSPMDDPALSYSESVSAGDGVLNGSSQLALKTVEFSPAQYGTLKQTLKTLEYDQRKAPIMTVADPAPATSPDSVGNVPLPAVQSDARILNVHKEQNVVDAHTSTFTTTYAKKILTYAGKIRESEIKIPYNPAFQSARLLRGVVITADGKTNAVSAGEMNTMDAGWNASAKRYTGEKTLVANLPGVEIGSTIEVSFEIVNTNVPFISGFESFQLPEALDRKSFVLTAPAGLEIHQQVTGPAAALQPPFQKEFSREDGRQSFHWQTGPISALPNEPQLPPGWAYDSGVVYYVGDLATYLKNLRDILLNRSGQSTKAAALALQLTGQTHGKLEALTALRDYVAKSIRTAGPSFMDLPLAELSAADTTLSDGYGHSADQAILLHAMLTAAGFHPEFVLASDLPPIAGITNFALNFPLPRSFGEPLVRVNVDGTNYYLNDTDQYAKLGATEYDGRLGLVLATQSTEVIHAAPGCGNSLETDYTLVPDSTGRTRVTVTRRYYGGDYNAKHRYFAELPPEERKRYYQELVSSLAQGARAVGDLQTEFGAYPGLEQFTADVDNYSVLDGNYFYFNLPFTPSLFAAGADRRALPLYVSYPSHRVVRTDIALPSGYHRVLMAPGSETLTAPDGSGKAAITSIGHDGHWNLTDEFDITPAIIPANDYPDLVKLGSTLGRKSEKVFLLEKE
jgi:transglutaminase-like putative cysteine protease